MSVFYENNGRKHGYESDVPHSRWARREREDLPLWGFSYNHAEGVVHLLLAFSIVGGAAAILSSGVFAPDAAQASRVEARAASVERLPQQRSETQPAAQPRAEAEAAPPPPARAQSGQADARSAAPADPTEKPTASLIDSRPLAEIGATPEKAPEPLAPPAATLREKLEPGEDGAQKAAAAAPPPVIEAAPARAEEAPAPEAAPVPPRAEAKSEDRGRIAHCYLKLAGRVQSSGSCRVRRTEESVILELPGKPLEIAHAHGRVWTAALGGRALGNVYRSGSCWGARGFYACEKG
ncbi:hypothetical protein WOC76_07785 [Methylocystis sp. IM3]|uniref:hypothetical protein n=1 Tax=unclassified Methylocystis TaxID=2625913 RepID=UPI000F9AA8F7|nr:MAG: hypothetical protein EKK29_02485 [Hyphomicrobiales bacterium]